jgi:hypothetical protein
MAKNNFQEVSSTNRSEVWAFSFSSPGFSPVTPLAAAFCIDFQPDKV